MKAQIRGIYSTAITKLLLENGFTIVNPSLAIKTRFGLPDNFEAPELKIKDRYDLQGITVLGTFASVNALQSIVHSALEDALTRKWAVSVDGIYKGKIVGSDESWVYVDLGNAVVGLLSKNEVLIDEDKPVIAQVERKRIGAKQPLLTTRLKIVGDYAILTNDNEIGVSLKIRNLRKRAELYSLGKSLAPNGWGVIWRETAAKQSRETLKGEMVKLKEKTEELKEKVTQLETPSLLIEGLWAMDVEFPYVSKRRCDELRAIVTPTLRGHHFYKSCRGTVSSALEMAEKLLEKEDDPQKVEKMLRDQISPEFPMEGSQVSMEHVKLSGAVFYLGEAIIDSIDDKVVKYNRTMQRNGLYDGLDVKKETGDKAISETKIGDWFITTKYFSANGDWKGTYINLNTPVEIYPKSIRYVDLEVDICLLPNGSCKILDMEKLEKAYEMQFISKKLFDRIKGKVKEKCGELEKCETQ